MQSAEACVFVDCCRRKGSARRLPQPTITWQAPSGAIDRPCRSCFLGTSPLPGAPPGAQEWRWETYWGAHVAARFRVLWASVLRRRARGQTERLAYSRRVRPEDFVSWGAGLEACLAMPKRVKKLDAALAQVCCVGWG